MDVDEATLLMTALNGVLNVIDTEGPDAVAWYRDDMDARAIIRHLLEDREKAVHRLACLVCTSERV